MAAVLIIKGVLGSVERDAIEGSLVSFNAECNSLPSDGTAGWGRGRVLHHSNTNMESETHPSQKNITTAKEIHHNDNCFSLSLTLLSVEL